MSSSEVSRQTGYDQSTLLRAAKRHQQGFAIVTKRGPKMSSDNPEFVATLLADADYMEEIGASPRIVPVGTRNKSSISSEISSKRKGTTHEYFQRKHEEFVNKHWLNPPGWLLSPLTEGDIMSLTDMIYPERITALKEDRQNARYF